MAQEMEEKTVKEMALRLSDIIIKAVPGELPIDMLELGNDLKNSGKNGLKEEILDTVYHELCKYYTERKGYEIKRAQQELPLQTEEKGYQNGLPLEGARDG